MQRGDPLFGLVFLGSIVTMLVALVLGGAGAGRGRAGNADRGGRALPGRGAGADCSGEGAAEQPAAEPRCGGMGVEECAAGGAAFEGRWNRWNGVRTVATCGAAVGLLVAGSPLLRRDPQFRSGHGSARYIIDAMEQCPPRTIGTDQDAASFLHWQRIIDPLKTHRSPLGHPPQSCCSSHLGA